MSVRVSIPTLAWVLPLLLVALWAWQALIARPLLDRMERWLHRRIDAIRPRTEETPDA